jgi:predicted negative regulator of RcsB-dependent stress response
MEYQSTDRDDIERLRKWWQENGMAIIVGVLLGGGGLLGWNVWNQWQGDRMEVVTLQFQQAQQGVLSPQADVDVALGAGAAAVLTQAAEAQRAGELEQARALLQQAVAGESTYAQLARLQWAALELEANAAEVAQQILSEGAWSSAFTAARAELQGDVAASQGDLTTARVFYQSAFEAARTRGDEAAASRIERLAQKQAE